MASFEREVLVEIFNRAHLSGMHDGNACSPPPMVVVQDTGDRKKSWFEPEGMCGFAWITIKPASCLAAKVAKEKFGARKAYDGGVQIWVREFDQSIARKQAYANAFTAVLMNAGINAESGSRLD